MRTQFETWCDTQLFPKSWKEDKGAWEVWQVQQKEIDKYKRVYQYECDIRQKRGEMLLERDAKIEKLETELVDLRNAVLEEVALVFQGTWNGDADTYEMNEIHNEAAETIRYMKIQ